MGTAGHQPPDGIQNGLSIQNTKQKAQGCSWLFQCWRPQNSEERSNGFHSKIDDRTGHQECRQCVPSVSDAKPNGVEAEGSAGQVEGSSVDKEAEAFIDKMRRKMNMEALKSMKRYESMMRRGY